MADFAPKTSWFLCAAAAVASVLPLLGGCDTAQQREENLRLRGEVKALQEQTAGLQHAVDASQQERMRLKQQVGQLNRTLRALEAARAATPEPESKALARTTTAPGAILPPVRSEAASVKP